MALRILGVLAFITLSSITTTLFPLVSFFIENFTSSRLFNISTLGSTSSFLVYSITSTPLSFSPFIASISSLGISAYLISLKLTTRSGLASNISTGISLISLIKSIRLLACSSETFQPLLSNISTALLRLIFFLLAKSNTTLPILSML